MTLDMIFKSFKELKTSNEKVEYLRYLQSKNLDFRINYEKLIEYWSNN